MKEEKANVQESQATQY